MAGNKNVKKDDLIKKNKENFDLEDNASELAFTGGMVTSKGVLRDVTIEVDLRYCKGCGICSASCPTQALRMVPEEGKLKKVIQQTVSEAVPAGVEVAKEAALPWQQLPHPGGLIIASGELSDNLTGAWRVGEVVIPDSNYCVDCGLCSQVCPEGIIDVNVRKDEH